uniref:Uncharacterized protein LOC104234822 n=1 Tax=Nicotiana sylvestris TaxID=4096 RepID=A0A1U7XIH6_NICSY|nr:PREDICTED: uncharacterized protein LOC104234822 [Nicotiana sylvestris]
MNGAVEEANKNIKRILRMIMDNHRQWHEKLFFALLGYRTTMRTSSGATPFMLVYGTEAIIPAEVEILSLRGIQEAKLDDAEWIRDGQCIQQKGETLQVYTGTIGFKENIPSSGGSKRNILLLLHVNGVLKSFMTVASSPQPLAVGEPSIKPTYAAQIQSKSPTQIATKTVLKSIQYVHGEPTVCFTMEERREFAMEEGLHQSDLARAVNYLSWNGEEHQYRVFPWTIGFNPNEENTMAVVWISLPNLSPELFAMHSLLSIASATGKPIAIDKAMQLKSRPSTARVKGHDEKTCRYISKKTHNPDAIDELEVFQEQTTGEKYTGDLRQLLNEKRGVNEGDRFAGEQNSLAKKKMGENQTGIHEHGESSVKISHIGGVPSTTVVHVEAANTLVNNAALKATWDRAAVVEAVEKSNVQKLSDASKFDMNPGLQGGVELNKVSAVITSKDEK